MSLRLVVVDPARDGALLAEGAFDGPEVTFGRKAGDNALVIPDPAKRVSSKHGAFVRRDGAWYVRDLGSLNGTLLQGETVPVDEQGLRVSHGDIITIGGLEMQVLEDASQALPTPDLGGTIAHFPEGREDQLIAELESIWLEHARNPKARAAAIEQHLRAGVADVMPDKAQGMLLRMAEHWGGAPALQDPDLQKREQLFRVAFDGLSDLSRNLVGDGAFKEADQVGRFIMLLRQALELAGEWIAKNLAARETFGEEFGAEVTKVLQRAKNPLKQREGAHEVLRFVLNWSDERPPATVAGYLKGVFEDLSQHQMGMLKGVEQAVRAIVQRIDPARLEAEVESAGLALSSRSSRAWEAYRKLYSDLLQERSRLFKEVVSPALRDGYLGAHDHPGAGP